MFAVTTRFWCCSLYRCTIVLHCWSLNFKNISNILHLYTPYDCWVFAFFFFFFLSLALQALHCSVQTFPLVVAQKIVSSCRAWAPEHTSLVVAAHGLSCLMACGILVSWPGIKNISPALESRFLTTGPPAMYHNCWFGYHICVWMYLHSTFTGHLPLPVRLPIL